MKNFTNCTGQHEAPVTGKILSPRVPKSVQVLYLGAEGKLTYANSRRAVSKRIADKLGISKFNFFQSF